MIPFSRKNLLPSFIYFIYDSPSWDLMLYIYKKREKNEYIILMNYSLNNQQMYQYS